MVKLSSMPRSGRFLVPSVLALFCCLLSVGCRREEVREYRVPKEHVAEPASGMPHNHPGMGTEMAAATPTPPKLSWKLPAGWAEKTPSAMRVASFSVTGKDGQLAEVGVIPLPTTGNELELVNMWRQQLHLPSVAVADADKQAESITVGAEQGKLFDIVSTELVIEGKAKARILVATISRGPLSWFFKMTGEDTLVVEQKPAFAEFLKSVVFEEVSVPEPAAATAPRAASESAAADSGLPKWHAPADWKGQTPGQMVLATYAVGDEASGRAMVNISSFPGDVGGLLANVNRWRGQVGLGAVAEADLGKTVTNLADGAKLVDFSGTDMASDTPKRLLGAIMPQGDKTWFYKMTGDEKVISQQKEAFIKFVETVKY